MKKVVRLSFMVAFCTLVFGMMAQSCGSSKSTVKNNSADSSLNNIKVDLAGTWILTSLNGQNANDIFKGRIPSLMLNFDTNQVNGNGGCNTYFGKFTFENGIFTAPNVASTMMACSFENREGDFYAMLGKENSLAVVDGVLTFTNNGVKVAEFVKGIDTGMLYGQWTLQSIDGENMSTLFPESSKKPTIEFYAVEKRLTGNAGCNNYNAPYTVNGMMLEVGPIMSTKMACPNLAGEDKFTNALSGTSTIEVTADQLKLIKDGKTVLTFVK